MAEAEFLQRDLSWLEFHRRVLHEASDPRTPLLERARFLAICAANLDEFFMKRIGGLHRRRLAGLPVDPLLGELRGAVLPLVAEQARVELEELRPALAREGIALAGWEALSEDERRRSDAWFESSVYPVLTPLVVDPGHPFPFVSNLSTSLAVRLRHPERAEEVVFGRVKLPPRLPPWFMVSGDARARELRLLRLQDLLARHLGTLFPGWLVLDVMAFRVTRNADVERDEEDAEDLLEMVAEELRERRFARVVRLEHAPDPSPEILRFLMDELELTEKDVYATPGELDCRTIAVIAELDRPRLKYEPWVPVAPAALGEDETSVFGVLRKQDVLVHHPYESFAASVERFVRAAVDDPKVLAIKMTLYRTGETSPFIPLLVEAAESGKQVVCLVELKARFDEERNIRVARSLEKSGVHVVYGLVGLKTHCKVTLVVREEAEGLRAYAHVGTGNYNSTTSRLYTDLGLFTSRPEITRDVTQLFNALTGRALRSRYERLLVSPGWMKRPFIERIEAEAENARQRRPARIVAKMNALEDPDVIRALYRASQAGVPIDLVVRGFCTLRPGVPGMSENIRVISIVGRFLEHSRLYHFARGEADPLEGEFLLGSADWMSRNLVHRVEAIAPVLDPALKERAWELLQLLLADRRQAWELNADGTYVQRRDGPDAIASQTRLMHLAKERAQTGAVVVSAAEAGVALH
jgi:polyphosphate kinase